MMKKRIIVTGANGFLGKHLCQKLVNNCHTLYEYDITHGKDILNIEQLDETFRDFKPDVIIHLAACADLNIFAEKPEESYQINVVGTRNILNMCKNYNVRLLFASTCCIYGNNNTHPTNENSPTCPTEPYAISKKESENEILDVGFPHCCMRLATFYGPKMRPALAPAIFLEKAHKNIPIEVHGTGKQTRTMTYVDDIVNGIVIIAESEPTYTIINITTEEETSVLDMISHAKRLSGNNVDCLHIDDRNWQIYKEVIESKRLQSLGWKWKTSFEKGMQNSYESYLKNNQSWQ